MKKGISLIVLVITIIVILILAGAVILSLSKNSPINSATEAKYRASIDSYNSELSLYILKTYANNSLYNPKEDLYATTWDGSANTTGTIKEFIPSITAEDGLKYSIQGGKISYSGTNENEIIDSASRGIKIKYENRPVLATGMKAVIWNKQTSTWDEITNYDTNTTWYDYENSRWANAMTKDGSMWVWIPRYIYKISSGWHSSTTGNIDVQFSKGTDDNWNSAVIGSINNGTVASSSNGTWTNHPAFTFGTTELAGIWVAKFQAGGTITAVDIKPGITSLTSITADAMFTASRNMEVTYATKYGWESLSGVGIDTHMMKNIEWGAVAYLSVSKYGTNGVEISVNTDAIYTGGGTGNSYITNVTQSTTRNIYGVYDMSGGVAEYTASYINSLPNATLTTYCTSIVNGANQYKDLYTFSGTNDQITNYNNSADKKGDAIYETSNTSTGAGSFSWFGDYSTNPYVSNAIFKRGAVNSSGASAGIFAFMSFGGGVGYADIGFRPVLLVSASL